MSIIIKNLSFSYEADDGGNEKKIIDSLSITLPDTGIFALTGPSGSGKTTLLRVIAGLEKNHGGEVVTTAKKTAFAFQESRLFPWLTAAENVAAVIDGKKEDALNAAVSLLELTGLGGDCGKYPSELSGGMKQRVSLCRALAYGGDCQLFDEPFSELDPEIRKKIRALIKTTAAGKLTLYVTHDNDDLEIADGELNFPSSPLTGDFFFPNPAL